MTSPTLIPQDEPAVASAECPVVVANGDSGTGSTVAAAAVVAPTNDNKKDLSEAVTTPLEALALICVDAEKKAGTTANTKKPHPQRKAPVGHPVPPNQNDVLCGRGGLTNNHPGNVFFRKLVRIKQESYLMASKREKTGVAREIVDLIRSLDPPGRFLKKDPNNAWVEIGDRKAREKTSQALREGAPELREELQTAEQQLVLQAKQRQPSMTSNPQSNRVRIVSDDSVSFEEQATIGTKRKEPCSMQDMFSTENNSSKEQRGPRLKLLKSRVVV
jgi:hypothetical protein